MRVLTLRLRIAVACALATASFDVWAEAVCELSGQGANVSPAALRIAQIACDEHALWRRPFINAQGRIVRIASMEAEQDPLGDGRTPRGAGSGAGRAGRPRLRCWS